MLPQLYFCFATYLCTTITHRIRLPRNPPFATAATHLSSPFTPPLDYSQPSRLLTIPNSRNFFATISGFGQAVDRWSGASFEQHTYSFLITSWHLASW